MATHETIRTTTRERASYRVADERWLFSLEAGINRVRRDPSMRTLRIDMNGAQFVSLFEWTSACALLQQLLESHEELTINIDFTHNGDIQLLPAQAVIAGGSAAESAAGIQSQRIYRIIGFLESLGTLESLNSAARLSRVSYGYVDMRNVEVFSSFYGGRDADTVINGLHRLATPEDCTLFLDDDAILRWRRIMSARFEDSPLFSSDEVWRVFCHELGVNVWEHAGANGVLAARIIEPKAGGRPASWWSWTYAPAVHDAIKRVEGPVLELCVADAGRGIVATLADAYLEATRKSGQPDEIIAFAFDDVGTSKDKSISWTTERHALGRVLRVVQKYGGAIQVRCDRYDVTYVHSASGQTIHDSGWGYKPARSVEHDSLRGTHVQLLIPLHPAVDLTGPRRARLRAPLPTNFSVESVHPIGHLVPLREYFLTYTRPLRPEEQRGFRDACEELNRNLLTGARPPNEPIVLDFTDLEWTPTEFETLLHYLEPVLQRRPSLLVELDPELTLEIERLENDREPSLLHQEAAPKAPAATGRLYGKLAEREFFETYNRIHVCVLGVDTKGKHHLFGVSGNDYKAALLELVHTPQKVDDLHEAYPDLVKGKLAAILNTANPAFEVDRTGVWSSVWMEPEMAVQSARALTAHFEQVASTCEAWAAHRLRKQATPPLFYLTWENQWLEDFFEASRLLTRERYADEVAQRLLARLAYALEERRLNLSDIGVLVGLTSPSLQLANALHRWWPRMPRPSVVDLGYYVGLADQMDVPVIPARGFVVMVQDVVDTMNRTKRVIKRLQTQGNKVVMTVAMVRMLGEQTRAMPTRIEDATEETPVGPVVSLMHLPRPKRLTEIKGDEEKRDHAYWIEPRMLQPIRYKWLSGETAPPQRETPQHLISNEIDMSPDASSILAGHYAYGRRHFDATIDMQHLIKSTAGERLASWIADVCIARAQRDARWESTDSLKYSGDVTAVLMPLHSQVHYLWPQVQLRLARRGRRQPFFLLDTTLFLTDEAAFHVPRQLYNLIRDAVRASRDRRKQADGGDGSIRLLIIDDAVASARTVETIIAAIDSAVAFASKKELSLNTRLQGPVIEWIRFFAIINKLSDHRNHFWSSVRNVGERRTTFLFDHYARFQGMSVYSPENCHYCRARKAREALVEIAAAYPGAEDVSQWAEAEVSRLEPVAIDTEASGIRTPAPLPVPIFPIIDAQNRPVERFAPGARHVDTAIWRFYEYMEKAVPPYLLLRSLPDAPPNQPVEVRANYYRYRATVLEWCLRHWDRILAHNAATLVTDRIAQEVLEGEMDVLPLMAQLAAIAREPEVVRLVRRIVDTLIEKDILVNERRLNGDPHAAEFQRAVRLENAITTFLLSRSPVERVTEQGLGPDAILLPYLEQRLTENRDAMISNTLLNKLLRPERAADPAWALMTVAETLYRGRDPEFARNGSHLLLPRILQELSEDPRDVTARRLAHSSASLFRAALADLEPYANLAEAGVGELQELLTRLIEDTQDDHSVFDSDNVISLMNALDLYASFTTEFTNLFHARVGDLLERIRGAHAWRTAFLELQIDASDEIRITKILTAVDALVNALLNWAIEPATAQRPGRAKLRVYRDQRSPLTPTVVFEITTDFAPLGVASQNILHGPNASVERGKLRAFGGIVNEPKQPSAGDAALGYTTTLVVTVPAGFTPRREGR